MKLQNTFMWASTRKSKSESGKGVGGKETEEMIIKAR